MTLPENYADGDVVHGYELDTWTDAINANTRKLVTPLAYGARGDGVTDDTAAVQSAINACALGGVVFFPPGKTFAYQGTLHVPQGVVLQGSGWVTEVPALKASTSDALISLDASYGGNDGNFQILRDLLIDGNNDGQIGIYCDIIDRPSLHGVMVRNFTQAGIVCDGTQQASFVHVSVYDCATQATNPGGWPAVGAIMLINGAQNCHFYNVTTSLYANGNANARSILITDIATDSRFHNTAFGGGNGPHSFNGGTHEYGGTASGSKPDYRIQIDACQTGTQFVFRDALISGSPCNSALVSIDVDDATLVSFEDCELALNTNSGTSIAASGGQVRLSGTTRTVSSTQVLPDTIGLSGTASIYATMTVIGSSSVPISDAGTARPTTSGAVYWICAAGVTPSHAATGDLIFNAS